MAHLKRLQRDIQTMVSEELTGMDIHYWYNDADLRTGQGLLFGPEDTPYAFCPLLFSVNIPAEYPFVSPQVLILSSDGLTRFHPNLYITGKVCLSILGTYEGPKWASMMNLGTVFKSIFSILNDNPIVNEPSWEKFTLADPRAKDYADWVEFNLLKYTVHQYRDYLLGANHNWNNFKEVFDGPGWLAKWSKIGEKIRLRGLSENKTYTNIVYGMNGKTDWQRLLADYTSAKKN